MSLLVLFAAFQASLVFVLCSGKRCASSSLPLGIRCPKKGTCALNCTVYKKKKEDNSAENQPDNTEIDSTEDKYFYLSIRKCN